MIAFVVFEAYVLAITSEQLHRFQSAFFYCCKSFILSIFLLFAKGELVSAAVEVILGFHPLDESVVP